MSPKLRAATFPGSDQPLAARAPHRRHGAGVVIYTRCRDLPSPTRLLPTIAHFVAVSSRTRPIKKKQHCFIFAMLQSIHISVHAGLKVL